MKVAWDLQQHGWRQYQRGALLGVGVIKAPEAVSLPSLSLILLFSGLQNPIDTMFHLQPLMLLGLFPLFAVFEGA